ncbi:hypothetical protein COLO4_37541 [Corchorus olitorius]|uniref:Uncharacterized protein n=1 Tax=Corchorus olitorius TaxID=93759 RepID=A0A1R3G0Y7_9ROSI|nr:hypothetical protein COLO4_37541 [Corchorus olitorius]
MSTSYKELELMLIEAGNRLVEPPLSVDEQAHPFLFPVNQGQSLAGLSSAKAIHYPASVFAGNRQFKYRGSVVGRLENEPADGATLDALIGRKVWTRWPEDNNFYEAIITDFNPSEAYA